MHLCLVPKCDICELKVYCKHESGENEVRIDRRLSYLYAKIKPKESDPPLTRQVKERIVPDVLARWKKYTENPPVGDRWWLDRLKTMLGM